MRSARTRVALEIVLLTSTLAGGVQAADTPRPGTPQFFDAHVAPLLTRHCLECHDAANRKGKLDLSRRDAALAGGKHGKAIVPGKAARSLVWKQVESDEMPDDRPPLSAGEKKTLKDWIDAGAVWPGDAIDPLALARDGRAAQNWLRRLTVTEYVETVRAAVGVDIGADARRLLPPDGRADGFTNTAYNLNVDLAHVEAYARLASIVADKIDAEAFAAQFSKRKELDDEAMRELIASMGKWLLRGPLDGREVDAFLRVSRAVAEDGGGYADAVRCVVEAMLQSPRFIYRIEKQRGDGTARPAEPYELASRISYTLWGAPPDKELFLAADAGELADRNRVASQVRRMLDDPRAVERSKQFISDWLNLDRLTTLRPNKQRFPHWDEQLAVDMREETLAFFEEVAWKQKRPLADLLDAKVTFATPRLAAHYGLTPRPTPGPSPSVAPAATVAAAKGPDRVTRALKALYSFEEGRGDTVRDVSGAGERADLRIEDAGAVKWTGSGLVVERPTLIATARPPARLVESLCKSSDLTIEAWVTPANPSQSGPARVVTLSRDPSARNFTLGQEGDRFDVRLRTIGTDSNGLPSLATPGGAARTRPTHLVYTRDANGRTKLYVDGEQKAARDVGGALSTWDRGFRLALANELTKDRPWLGTLHLVALYDTALTAEEVSRNRAAGPRRSGAAPVAGASPSPAPDLLALYRFDEGAGDTVRDTSGAGDAIDLKIESTSGVRWDSGGLTVNEPTLIGSASAPKRLMDALKKSNALTLEAWVAPRDAKQAGPARVLTLSDGTGTRNFTLGQDGDKYDVRLRSTSTDANGMPSLGGRPGSSQSRLTHVVYTRTRSGQARLYVDGEEKGVADVGGDFSNWDGSFRLALANETTKDRPWRGTFRRVAVYGRALSADEVRGLRSAPPPPQEQGIARYDLTSTSFRGGLLTQGSVLTVGGEEASTVARGLFVLKELLHSAVGSAPPGVDTTPVPPKPGLSTRAIAEGRLAISSCSGCHQKFEPLAFGLGKFDGVGAYREKDDYGNVLRDDGEVTLPGDDKPSKFKSAAEFMDLLARSDRVRMNFTRKVTQFALGRPLVESDGPELERIHKAAQEAGGTYAAVVTAFVLSDLVQTTRTEAGP